MAGNRIRMVGGGAAQSAFSQSSIVLAGSHILTGSAAGTVIGTLSLSGPYSGPITWSLDNSAGGTVALDGVTVRAGATATDFATNPTVTPTFRASAGDEFLTASPTITVDNTATPTDFVIKPTGQALIDLSVTLAPISELDTITLAVDGPVTADVWLVEQVADGQSKTFVKRELVNMLSAVTVGAPLAAPVATWTLTWTGGSAEITFATSYAPVLTHDMGANTLSRYGGYGLAQLGAGTWTISTQSTANAFEVFNNRLVWKASGSPAVNSYGTAKVITSPTTGAAAYTVDVTDGSTTHTITFNVIPNQWDIAPTPTTGVNAMNINDRTTWQYYQIHRQALRFGDTIILEDGTYKTVAVGFSSNISGTTTRTQRSGGPSAPTSAGGDGWITVKSRNYLGAFMPDWTQYDHQFLPNQYMSYENIDFFATRHFCSAGPKSTGWIRFRYNRAGGFSATGNEDNGNFNWYILHNDLVSPRTTTNASQTALFLPIIDSEVIGNRFDGSTEECIKMGMHNSVYGSGACKIWFNFFRNKRMWNGNTDLPHPDYIQLVWGPNYSPLIVASATVNWEAPSTIGNIMTRGTGSVGTITRYGETGKDAYGAQGVFYKDVYGRGVLFKSAGNIYIDGMGKGINIKNPLPGSVINYNTVMRDWAVTNPNTIGAASWGNPDISADGNTGANVPMKRNIVRGIQLNGNAGDNITSTQIDNAIPTSVALWEAYVTNHEIGAGAQTIQNVLDAMTPIHTNSIGRGAVANGLIDHRRQTFDPALLATS